MPFDPAQLDRFIAQKDAEAKRRESIQGKGKPIISAEIAGHKIVAVGNTIHWSKTDSTKTFTDFLGKYIRTVLTPEWGNAEIAKPLEERHPVMQWYDSLCRLQQRHYKPGEVFETPGIGLVIAYNSLAYNLYLLAHNAEVQAHLIRRLKDPKTFYAALYETHVAAWFILAGFKLTLENEGDSTSSHCEFAAEAPSGQRYSVEAKSRQPGKDHLAIGNQMFKALGKKANHARIVCIEMNVRQDQLADENAYADAIVGRIRKKEQDLLIEGQPAPPAFMFVSNEPHHLHLHDETAKRALLVDGYKIADFGFKTFRSIADGYRSRLKYADVLSVAKAFQNYRIPSTFDGEIPEFAFGQAERRFIIGDRHKMDDGVIGTLRQGTVLEGEKAAYLVYETESGKHVIYRAPLSDAELSAYRQHPETFFGRIERVGGTANTAMELYEFFYNSYKETPREKLLELFATAPDIAALRELPTEELRFTCMERYTLWAVGKREVPDLKRK